MALWLINQMSQKPKWQNSQGYEKVTPFSLSKIENSKVNGNREVRFLITDFIQRNNRSILQQEKSWIRVLRIGFNFQDVNKLPRS